jgi:hypothetical protein
LDILLRLTAASWNARLPHYRRKRPWFWNLDPNLGLVSRRRSSHLSYTFEVRTSHRLFLYSNRLQSRYILTLTCSRYIRKPRAAHDIVTAHRILRGDNPRTRPQYGLVTFSVAMADGARRRSPRDSIMASKRYGGREDAGGLLHTRSTRRAEAIAEDARRVS